jgi:hypothetical protein
MSKAISLKELEDFTISVELQRRKAKDTPGRGEDCFYEALAVLKRFHPMGINSWSSRCWTEAAAVIVAAIECSPGPHREEIYVRLRKKCKSHQRRDLIIDQVSIILPAPEKADML